MTDPQTEGPRARGAQPRSACACAPHHGAGAGRGARAARSSTQPQRRRSPMAPTAARSAAGAKPRSDASPKAAGPRPAPPRPAPKPAPPARPERRALSAAAPATPAARQVAQRPRPVNSKPGEGIRLSKALTEQGIASRREADDWIAAGWVRVDGQMAVLGQRVRARAAHRHRPGRAQGAGAQRHHLAEQTGGPCQRPSRGRLSAGGSAHHRRPTCGPRTNAPLPPRPCAWPGAGRAAGHRLHRAAGADAGRAHRQAADRRELAGREGIPGARGARLRSWRARFGDATAASRPRAGRRSAETGQGELGQRGPVARRAAAGQEAPDPPHVRSRRPAGAGAEAGAHRQRGAGQAARRAVALSARVDERFEALPAGRASAWDLS